VTAAPPVEVFSALGDPTRQRLLETVAQGGRTTADMAALLDITRQAVEKQLRVLEQAGLVRRQRLGRRVQYAVRPDALADTATWLSALADTWDRRLGAVKALAESDANAGPDRTQIVADKTDTSVKIAETSESGRGT
jgi:DNA-binding transcriptional ArsR family regulator